jgi:hypothetical protein
MYQAIGTIKDLAQILAWIAAAGFFTYKAISGYFVVDASLRLDCERKRARSRDFLSVTATLKKGERGAIALVDARVRVRNGGNSATIGEPQELVGIRRLSYASDGDEKKKITFDRFSQDSTLNFAPGDEMQFSAFFDVGTDDAYVIEAVVLARRVVPWIGRPRFTQWRSSRVSLPLET